MANYQSTNPCYRRIKVGDLIIIKNTYNAREITLPVIYVANYDIYLGSPKKYAEEANITFTSRLYCIEPKLSMLYYINLSNLYGFDIVKIIKKTNFSKHKDFTSLSDKSTLPIKKMKKYPLSMLDGFKKNYH
jgi:hypothetical protein